MRVLLIAPYCFGLERSLQHALEANGCEVLSAFYGNPADKPSAVRALLRFPHATNAVKRLLYRSGLMESYARQQLVPFNHELRQTADRCKPDIILIVKGEVVFPQTVASLAQRAFTVAYYWDDPFLSHLQKISDVADPKFSNLRDSARHFHISYVYDPEYLAALREAGAVDARFLMHWFEDEYFQPGTVSVEEQQRLRADVAFVGSPYLNRIQALESLQAFDVGVWGPAFRWEPLFRKHPALRRQYRGECDSTAAAKIYSAATVSLNIHDDFQCFGSFNNRTLQIMAAGGLQLVDDRKMIREVFRVGHDLDVYNSHETLQERVEYYLERPQRAAEIRRHAVESSRPHSSTKRIASLLNDIRRKMKDH